MNASSLIRRDRLFAEILAAVGEQKKVPSPLPLVVNGLTAGAEDAFSVEAVRALRADTQAPPILLVPDEARARRVSELFRASGLTCPVFPGRVHHIYEYSASHDTERERLFALHSLLFGTCDALVTTPGAAMEYTVPKSRLTAATLSLRSGETCDPDALAARLISLGYARTDLVEAAGQFARRGGILDIWTQAGDFPYRVEFFGDEVDRMCTFDPLTQRVLERCDGFLLLPAHEVFFDGATKEKLLATLEKQRETAEDGIREEYGRGIDALLSGSEFFSRDRYLPLIYPERETLFDYPDTPPVVLLFGTNDTNTALADALAREADELRPAKEAGLLSKDYSFSKDKNGYTAALARSVTLHLNPFTGGALSREGGLFGFRTRRLPTYAGAPGPLSDDTRAYLSEGRVVLIVTGTPGEAANTVSYLRDLDIPAVTPDGETPQETLAPGVAYVTPGFVSSGFELMTPGVCVLSLLPDGAQESRRRLRVKKTRRYDPGEKLLSALDLSPGDYVVHERYGIGIFEGMETLRRDGAFRDYIRIRYAGTGMLFIPADNLDAVTRYIGAGSEDRTVRLSDMNSPAWSRAKSRAKNAARDMAKELIALYAARSRTEGIAYTPYPEMETEFAGNFDFELTESQEEAVADIFRDMEKPNPMDRLLCGDVGFGKTEVALRAAFRAIANGYQVALLVPTTILAMQHYETALARMRGFAVTVAMLSRFRTAKEAAGIKRRVARGEVDLLIGTHALLGKEISFKKLGLLIIDEEQRFGVAQKEKIKSLAKNVDVLTLTATPIPRTLNMAVSGIRDLSLLDEAPGERRPVETCVLEYREDILNLAIKRELARAGQVLYLINDIEHIDLVAGRISEAHPAARVAYAHGRMDRETIEDVWSALVRGETDILVCTTIIETGVDLPNANTLIIENADRMGLAQLHQIRGRIGRSSRQAYAYFTYKRGKVLSDIAEKRLSAIREYASFGAGFRIALRDLEIRGAGDILGADQHGHIESVGYDLYIRLLANAVLEEEGKLPEPTFEARIDLGVDAIIPERYIPTSAGRMEMYKKISLIESEDDLSDLLDELCDRYGAPPRETERLLRISLSRALASRAHISLVKRDGGEIHITEEKLDLAALAEVYARVEGVRAPDARHPYITLTPKRGTDPTRAAQDFLVAYSAAKEKQKEVSDEKDKA